MTATAHFAPATGNLPPNANQAGYEPDHTPLYVARASHEGGQHPGKYRADWQAASISYGGREVWVPAYDIWTGHLSDGSSGTWIYWGNLNGWSPVVCGHEADLTQLYAARAKHEGGQHIGKWRRDWTAASISYGGAELWLSSFEVLCAGTTID